MSLETDEMPSVEVEGELVERYVPVLRYTQVLIGGVDVDPSTVVVVDPD